MVPKLKRILFPRFGSDSRKVEIMNRISRVSLSSLGCRNLWVGESGTGSTLIQDYRSFAEGMSWICLLVWEKWWWTSLLDMLLGMRIENKPKITQLQKITFWDNVPAVWLIWSPPTPHPCAHVKCSSTTWGPNFSLLKLQHPTHPNAISHILCTVLVEN